MMNPKFSNNMIKGNILNVFTGEIYPAEITTENGLIKCVKQVKQNFNDIILPGFIDAHIHIESSMLTPSGFAEVVVPHGTTSVVADPHEIANVIGSPGIEYMIKDALSVPLKFFFTAPSCVPATAFETSGAQLDVREVDKLLDLEDIVALGEMMNFPGVLADEEEVIGKINSAKQHRKPIDGHAPLLSGEELCKYIGAGISTDHECTIPEEVLEKRNLGMKIMLRQGSSARNLKELINSDGDFIVSDDKHPQDLMNGHVDLMLKEAVEYGLDPIDAVKMVTVNPASHYNLENGVIAPGKAADMVVVDGLQNFSVKKVFINSELVARDGKPFFTIKPEPLAGTFELRKKIASDFEITSNNREESVRVIEVSEGQILTNESEAVLNIEDNKIKVDFENDILKIAVVERYGHERICNGFIKGFNLKKGAIASSIAHDSHNIIVIGSDTDEMALAVNQIAENQGGLVAVSEGDYCSLKLPIAGLMSDQPVDVITNKLGIIQNRTKDMGCTLESPFMTLSFMALLVIPSLKISDRGLFNGKSFQFVDVIKKINEK
jgi:adenine deaminase